MKFRIQILLLCGLVIISFITIAKTQESGEDDDYDDEDEDSEETELLTMRTVKDANRKFASNYYNVLRSSFPEGNLVYSPYSMSMVLAMLGTGSKEATNKEIKRTLKLRSSMTDDEMTEGMSAFIQSMRDVEKSGFRSVQRIFVPSTHSVRQSYKDNLLENFHTTQGVRNINFEQSSTAAKKMNSWMYQKTNGKIDSIISPDVLSKDTQLVLVSGVYADGKWETGFEKRNDLFFVKDAYAKNMTTLIQTGSFKYADLKELRAQAVAIPYVGGRLELVVVLPNFKTEGIVPLENRLRNVSLTSIASRLYPNNVQLILPEFRMETFLPLSSQSPMLRQLGLNRALTNQLLHFTGISPFPGLHVDQIIQKSILEVRADGETPPDSSNAAKPFILFKADHPFLAFVHDTETETILLISRKVE